MLSLTDQRWRELQSVQAEINARVGYRTDLDLYGRPDLWVVADREGDCEDYALAKRQALLGLGWPVQALRLALCVTEAGQAHAVLTVDTDQGCYVLDNRFPEVAAWTALPYRWTVRQAAGGPSWVAIGRQA